MRNIYKKSLEGQITVTIWSLQLMNQMELNWRHGFSLEEEAFSKVLKVRSFI
jgi:hypothetical protein